MPERVRTDEAPPFELFDLPISQAVIHGGTVYVSGQTEVLPDRRDGRRSVEVSDLAMDFAFELEVIAAV